MSVTKQDVIAHLRAEREKLTTQLNDVETALKAFLPPSHASRTPRAKVPNSTPVAPTAEAYKMVAAHFPAGGTKWSTAQEVADALGVVLNSAIYGALTRLTKEGVILVRHRTDAPRNPREYRLAPQEARLHVTT